MKKKNTTLMILVVLLVVLCAGYVGIVKYKEAQDQKQQEASEAEEEANKIVLNQMDDIVALSFNTTDGQLSFHAHDDVWHYDGDEAFPLNTSKINLILNNLNPLEATRKLEEKEDLSNYGLTEPSKTVTITDAAGNQKVLNIGSMNEYSGDYYASIAGDDNVYTIGTALVNSLDVTLNDLLQLDTIPYLTESDITQIEYKTATESVVYKKEERVKETEETQQETDSSEVESTSTSEETTSEPEMETVWTETRNGTTVDLSDSTKITDAISSISQLSINSCEAYNVSTEQFASYGLDEANSKDIIITYNDATSETQEQKTFTLHIGNLSAQETSYYCIRVDESTQVDRIAAFSIDSIISDLQQVGEPAEETESTSESASTQAESSDAVTESVAEN